MTTSAHVWRKRREAAAASLATWSGIALRRIGKSLPGTMGPALVVIGLAGWSWQLGVVVAGVILWALDRRVP